MKTNIYYGLVIVLIYPLSPKTSKKLLMLIRLASISSKSKQISKLYYSSMYSSHTHLTILRLLQFQIFKQANITSLTQTIARAFEMIEEMPFKDDLLISPKSEKVLQSVRRLLVENYLLLCNPQMPTDYSFPNRVMDTILDYIKASKEEVSQILLHWVSKFPDNISLAVK